MDAVDRLQHFGVKGMKWGVRRADPGGAGAPNRAEKKHLKKAASHRGLVAVHNGAADRMNNIEVPRINKKPEYRNKDFTRDSPLRRKYYKEYETTLDRVMVDEYNKQFGTAPTGRKLKFGMKNGQMSFEWGDARHATGGDIPFKVQMDDRGYITGIVVVEMTQSSNDILEHYGVKGMRWGVRRAEPGSPSSDYRQVARISRKVSSGGGTHTLSNKEMRAFIERANLERQYNSLKPRSVGSQVAGFVAGTLLNIGRQEASKLAGTLAAKGVAAALTKIRK